MPKIHRTPNIVYYTIHINNLKYISENLIFAEILKIYFIKYINYIFKIIKIKNNKNIIYKLNKSAISFFFLNFIKFKFNK